MKAKQYESEGDREGERCWEPHFKRGEKKLLLNQCASNFKEYEMLCLFEGQINLHNLSIEIIIDWLLLKWINCIGDRSTVSCFFLLYSNGSKHRTLNLPLIIAWFSTKFLPTILMLHFNLSTALNLCYLIHGLSYVHLPMQ